MSALHPSVKNVLGRIAEIIAVMTVRRGLPLAFDLRVLP
jgi:hypothetical protein